MTDGYYADRHGAWRGFHDHNELSTTNHMWRAWRHDRMKGEPAPVPPRAALERRFRALREARLMLERSVDALGEAWPDAGLEGALRQAWEGMGQELERMRQQLAKTSSGASMMQQALSKDDSGGEAEVSTQEAAPFKVVDSRGFQGIAVSLGLKQEEVSKEAVWRRFERKQIEEAFGGTIRWI